MLVIFLILAQTGFSSPKNISLESEIQEIHERWFREAFTLTRNCVGFSAPVSARAYAYLSITAYESSLEIFSNQHSFSRRLNDYTRTHFIHKKNKKKVNWALIANSADYQAICYLYRGMPPSNKKKIDQLFDSIRKVYSTNLIEPMAQFSEHYGANIAQEIIDWSKTDGGDLGYLQNFPENYNITAGEFLWRPTNPGYLPALLPFWGSNRTLLNESRALTSTCSPPSFSSDTSNWLFKDSQNIKNLDYTLQTDLEVIAEYWNDSPGYSGTPSGHFFCLAMDLVNQNKLTPQKAIQLYATLGIALNEALISCWKLKYTYNFLRPITFIQRHIEPHYNTLLDSPPFPEFPSGHSFQSGAGCEVLKAFFGNTITFVDSTLLYRRDIDNTPRTYTSIDDLSEEISISRFYGGIHYETTLRISLHYGRIIGQYVSTECAR